jgi:hypothetical protein
MLPDRALLPRLRGCPPPAGGPDRPRPAQRQAPLKLRSEVLALRHQLRVLEGEPILAASALRRSPPGPQSRRSAAEHDAADVRAHRCAQLGPVVPARRWPRPPGMCGGPVGGRKVEIEGLAQQCVREAIVTRPDLFDNSTAAAAATWSSNVLSCSSVAADKSSSSKSRPITGLNRGPGGWTH